MNIYKRVSQALGIKHQFKKKKSPHPQGAHTLVGEESFELSYENHSMRKHTTGVQKSCATKCAEPPQGQRGAGASGRWVQAGVRRPPWLTRSLAEGLLSADTGAHWALLASSRDGWIRPVLCMGTLRVSGLPQITGEPAFPAGSSPTSTPVSLLHEQEEEYFQH